MPRPSSASLTVLPVSSLARISPPSGLTDGEYSLFCAVVNSKPADWFGEDSAPLLVEYVRAQGMCDRLDLRLKAILEDGETDVKVVKDSMQLRDMESKRLLQLATKLRLTQQSRYTPMAAATAQKHATGGTKPWQRVSKDPS